MRGWSMCVLLVLLLTAVCCSGARGQPSSPPTTTTTTPHPTFPPSTAPLTPTPGRRKQVLQTVFAQTSAAQAAAKGNNSASLLVELLSKAPGILQGGGGVDLSQGSAATLLSQLFADPRAAGIPAWIEALTQGANGSVIPDWLHALGNQSSAVQTLALLGRVFSDTVQGMQSLNLSANSSLPDILSAVMNDTGLMTSLSTDALQLLSALTGSSDVGSVLQESFPVDPTSQCALDLLTWASALLGGMGDASNLWAFQMLDAMGKLQAGLMTGQRTLVGDYAQCQAVSYTSPNTSHTLHTQFCPMAFSAPPALDKYFQGQSLVMQLCVPKSCTVNQLQGLFSPALKVLGSEHKGIQCVGPRSPEGDSRFIGATATLAVLAALCAIGTVYGVLLDRQKAKQKKQQQQQPQSTPVQLTAYTNNACVVENGDANLKSPSHMNGEVTNEKSPNTPTENGVMKDGDDLANGITSSNGHVIGEPLNEKTPNGAHVAVGYVKHCEEKEVNLKDAEGGMVKSKVPSALVVCDSDSASKPSKGSSPPAVQEGALSKLLQGFSVLKNGTKVLSCDRSPADVSCLHGIRVLSITWVVLGHTYFMINSTFGNAVALLQSLEAWTFTAFPAGMLAVDTFFLLSGTLSSLLFLRSTKKSGVTVSGLVLYYIHRVWRLTPVYAVILAVYIGIFPYLKEGPYQYEMGMDSEQICRDYWYLNILYVNNLFDVDHMCFGWSWYLSNDMQFSFLAPLVLVPWALNRASLKRLRVVGFLLCAGLILTHCISAGVITYVKDLGMANSSEFYKVYMRPWSRVGPYAVGLLLGYALFVTPAKYSMKKLSVFLGWTLATAVGLTLAYVRYDDMGAILTKGFQWNAAENAAYESVHRVLWAACVAWVIFACYKGYGGFVNTLLSWSAWMPLSRLTYGVYLLHLVVLFVLAGQFKKPFYFDNFTMTTLFLATTVLSYMLSFVFSMLVEAPTLSLEKVVLGKIFRSKK